MSALSDRCAWCVRVSLALALTVLAGCTSSEPFFEQRMRLVQASSVSAHGRLVHVSETEHRPASRIATWEVEVPDHVWRAYVEVVSVRLRALGFEAQEGTDDVRSFAEVLPGDMYVLRIERVATGPPLHVRLRLTAMAD